MPSAREAGPRTDFSFGERAFGGGRWDSALTEPFHSYVRSLIRTPLRVVASYSGDAAFEKRLGSYPRTGESQRSISETNMPFRAA